MVKQLTVIGMSDFPAISGGVNIADLLLNNARRHKTKFLDNDILIITQKIISKSEYRLRDLRDVNPSAEAYKIANITEKRPQLIQLILEESKEVLRIRKGLIIVKHNLGFVCANAGIDHSNTVENDEDNNYVLLLPENPDQSAQEIRKKIEAETGKHIGVLIIDTHGRAWRNGTTGVTIGLAGIPGVVDLRGKKDLFGYTLRVTQVAAADELAAAASLLMGQADEGIPCVIARGFPYELRDSNLNELIRDVEHDLFR